MRRSLLRARAMCPQGFLAPLMGAGYLLATIEGISRAMEGERTAALTVWGEARGEDEAGRRAVAWGLRTRLDTGRWGSTLDAVCKAKWQFSCWNANDPNRAKMEALPEDDPVYVECLRVVREVMASPSNDDPTNGATHYFAVPMWAVDKTPVLTHGRHWFFNTVR